MPATPASEADSAVSPLIESRPALNAGRLVVLAALSVATTAALWYGFAQGNNPQATLPRGSVFLWLVVAVMLASAIAALIGPLVAGRQGWWAKFIRLVNAIPLVWPLLATACIASFVIAQVANSQPSPRNYWPLFGVWTVIVISIAVWAAAGVKWTSLRWATIKQWLMSNRWELAAVVAMTAAAAALRVTNLTTIPLPFEQDEAALARESVHVLEGQTTNMFISGLQGHATMQFFAQAVFLKVFGINVFSIRLITAVVGVLTIPVFYLLLRQMFGRTLALLGSVFVVGYALHVHYSRVGMENIADPFLMAAALYFAWRASREGKTVDFVVTGVVLGLGLYLSPAARVIPLIVAAFFGYMVLRRPRFLRQALPGVGAMTLAYGAAALPVAVFWFTHNSFFMDRINVVGIYQSHWIDQQQAATGESALNILWDQAVHAFGGFGRYTDTFIFYHGPISLVDHLTLFPFLLGMAYAVYKVLDERYFLLLAIFGAVVVTGGVLTLDPPTSQRLLGTIPAVAAFTAIGVKLIADQASRLKPSASPLVAGVAIAALLTVNVNYYFFQYRNGGYSSDLNNRVAAQMVDYVRTLPEETRLFWYGDPRMYLSGSGHPAMTFFLRERPRFDVLRDGRVASNPVVDVSDEAPAVFMFLPHRQGEVQPLIDSCPGGELRTFIMPAGRHGLQGIQEADVSFWAYEVLTPNHCLPLTAQQ